MKLNELIILESEERLNRVKNVEDEYRLPNLHKAVPTEYIPLEARLKLVTIYRGVPSTVKNPEIRPGDWVSLKRNYARKHGIGESGKSIIISKKVPSDHVAWAGTDMNEFFYVPR